METPTTFNIVTAFPKFFDSFLQTSLIKKSIDKELLLFNIVDLKNFGIGNYNKIDDKPYSGGTGMVIRVDVVDKALSSLKNKGKVIALTPKGKLFKQEDAAVLQQYCNGTVNPLTILCGRYEGFDARVFDLADKLYSIGEFVTIGGEAPAMCLIESIIRLQKGILGDLESTTEESYSNKYYTEYPIYTRPEVYKGKSVPKVLLSGNHKEVEDWKNLSGVVKNTLKN